MKKLIRKWMRVRGNFKKNKRGICAACLDGPHRPCRADSQQASKRHRRGQAGEEQEENGGHDLHVKARETERANERVSAEGAVLVN